MVLAPHPTSSGSPEDVPKDSPKVVTPPRGRWAAPHETVLNILKNAKIENEEDDDEMIAEIAESKTDDAPKVDAQGDSSDECRFYT